jgi:GntR family transcriptional regulator, transcriptional repressor for pyruvate dehydrogenase complex
LSDNIKIEAKASRNQNFRIRKQIQMFDRFGHLQTARIVKGFSFRAICVKRHDFTAKRVHESSARFRKRPNLRATSTKTPSTLSNLKLEPGYKRVADAIETQIVAGQLKAGELLPTETELADILGVHRSTIREGIRSLENAGLVQRGAGKRLRVSVPDMSDVSSVVTRALGLKQVSFLELWEMQMLLEPFAAKLAALRISPALEHDLRMNVTNLRENLHDDDYVIRNDTEFHQLIAEAAQNAALSLSAAPIGALLFSATVNLYASVPQARHRLLESHEKILAAILKRDEKTAEDWMARHIRDFYRGYEIYGVDVHEPIALDPRAMEFVRPDQRGMTQV